MLPLKDVMESDFAAEIQPLRVHQIAVPDIGLHFPCKGRCNMIREGLCPGLTISSNHLRLIDGVRAASVDELVDQDVMDLVIEHGYEPDEPPQLPEALVEAPDVARGSGDLSHRRVNKRNLGLLVHLHCCVQWDP